MRGNHSSRRLGSRQPACYAARRPQLTARTGAIAALGLAVMNNVVTTCPFSLRLENVVPTSLCHSPVVESRVEETSTRATLLTLILPLLLSYVFNCRSENRDSR